MGNKWNLQRVGEGTRKALETQAAQRLVAKDNNTNLGLLGENAYSMSTSYCKW